MTLRLIIFSCFFLSHLAIQAESSSYVLKASDTIAVSVFQEPELSAAVTLTRTGEATFALIGSQKLAGLTLQEANDLITAKYKDGYLVNPIVTINLSSAAVEKVTVVGSVMSPGDVVIPSNSPLDLVSALASAGGLSPQADRSKIQVKRGDKTTLYKYSTIKKPGADQIILHDGDRIDVPVNPRAGTVVTLIGEIANPGEISLPLNSNLDLTTAIGRAGGLTPQAHRPGIRIRRGTKVYSTRSSGATVLQPGDVVEIPPSPYLGKTVSVNGQVGRPGLIPFSLDGRLSILTAINLAGGTSRIANKRKILVTRKEKSGSKTYTVDILAMANGKTPIFYLKVDDVISVPERRF